MDVPSYFYKTNKMNYTKLSVLIGLFLFIQPITSQQLYTKKGTDPTFESLLKNGTIQTGRNTTPNVPASTIDVNNNQVEKGPYAKLPFTKSIKIHSLTNSVIKRNNFLKMRRWYQEDGNTQVFRLFKGEHNVRNARKGAARIEAFSEKSWGRGAWHEWVGTYTIVKPTGCAIFQAKSNSDRDWSVQLNLSENGDIKLNHRRGTDKIIARNMTGKSFDIRIRDNGLNYEVYLNGSKMGSGSWSRPEGKNVFRWGMYVGGKTLRVKKDAMIFVTGATVDPGNIPNPPTNKKPAVQFEQVTNQLTEGYTDYVINAKASDPDGVIAKVDLYVNNKMIRSEKQAPYQWGSGSNSGELVGLQPGSYQIKATATDNDGATASDTYTLTVKKKSDTTANQKPVVKISKPSGTLNLKEGYTNLEILAEATDVDGTIAQVALYINDDLFRVEKQSPYTWGVGNKKGELDNLKPGIYSFKALTTDNKGATASDVVTVIVKKKETVDPDPVPDNTCNFGTPRSDKFPTLNRTSFSNLYVLGKNAPDLSTIRRININWNATYQKLYQFAVNTKNGKPNYYVDLRQVTSHNLGSAQPSITITNSQTALDGTYWVNLHRSNLVLVSKDKGYTIYCSNETSTPNCSKNVVASFDTNAVSIFPVPLTSSTLTLANLPENMQSIMVYNTTGNQLYIQTQNLNYRTLDIDLAQLATGLYFVEVKSLKILQRLKFIKK